MTPRHTITMVLAAASLLFAPAASAQETDATPEIAAEQVSDGQVVSFVNAMIAIDRVRREFLPQIEAAETDEDRQALAEEADTKAKAAVDGVAGISADEYLAIGRAAQGSEELAERINVRIAEMKEKQQGGGASQQKAPEDEAEGETPEE